MNEDDIRNVCTQSGKEFPDAQKQENYQKYNKNVINYPCKHCSKTFSSPDYLQQHIIENPSHREKKPYKCDECGKTFKIFSSVKRHANAAHRGGNAFSSDQCGEAFIQSSEPEDHNNVDVKPQTWKHSGKGFKTFVNSKRLVKRIHTRAKLYNCHQCGKTFVHSGNLTMHMFSHQKEKPHQCKECGKTFTHSGSLSNHKYIHTGEKPYKCDLCDMAFPKPSIRAKHRLIHLRQQKCVRTRKKVHSGEKSGVTLGGSGSPVKNKFTYSEEKAHKCGQCGKAFKNESALRDHSLWHSKKVAIPCGECGIVFWSRQVYLSHRCLRETDKVAVSL